MVTVVPMALLRFSRVTYPIRIADMSSAGREPERQVNRSSRKRRVSATVRHARLLGGQAGSGTHARAGHQLGEVYHSDRETTAEGALVAPSSQFARKLASRRLGKHTVWPHARILSALFCFVSVRVFFLPRQSVTQPASGAGVRIYILGSGQSVSHGRRVRWKGPSPSNDYLLSRLLTPRQRCVLVTRRSLGHWVVAGV